MKTLCQLLVFVACFVRGEDLLGQDPLPSWQDNRTKESLLAFVEKVTEAGSRHFVPKEDRLAVFDNDGTLWPEYPMPFELAFAIDEVKRLARAKPELMQDSAVRAAVADDFSALFAGEKHDGFVKIMALTHANMTSVDFAQRVENWMKSARHPRYRKRYDRVTYEPMQEVLRLLRSKDFKIAIVSGGGIDFMRQFSQAVYGVEPEWVLGSSTAVTFEIVDDRPVFTKQASGLFVNDKAGKSIRIYQQLGRRPIACFGNSDGDQSMLQYTTIGNPHPSLGVLIHHTDAEREYAYDERPAFSGKLVSALAEATQRGWTVVDMKRDWKQVFREE